MVPWYNVYCLGLFNTQISYESFTCTRIYARAFNLIIFEIPKAYFGFFFLDIIILSKAHFLFSSNLNQILHIEFVITL